MFQELADTGTAHPFAIEQKGRLLLHDKVEFPPQTLQQGEITPALRAKTKVVADIDGAGVEMPYQDLADEVLGRERSHSGIKAGADHMIGAVMPQGVCFFPQAAEPYGCLRSEKELARQRLEGQDGARQSAVGHLGKKPLVSQVNAIEVPNGHGLCRCLNRSGQRMQAQMLGHE